MEPIRFPLEILPAHPARWRQLRAVDPTIGESLSPKTATHKQLLTPPVFATVVAETPLAYPLARIPGAAETVNAVPSHPARTARTAGTIAPHLRRAAQDVDNRALRHDRARQRERNDDGLPPRTHAY
jgi:hypothetical protein